MTDSPDPLDTAEPRRKLKGIDAVLLLLSLFASLAVAASLIVRTAT